jgi:hypothetical protein
VLGRGLKTEESAIDSLTVGFAVATVGLSQFV